jgi:hypothetical protein
MTLDDRTREIIMAMALGVLIGVAVYLIQRKFTRERYEGEEDLLEEAEEELAGAEDIIEEANAAIEELLEEGEELEDALIAESEDIGEEEIDDFDEALALAQTIEDLELPGSEEMDEDIDEAALEEAAEPEIDIAKMAQEAIMAEISKAIK